jgi:hypothetical protein
MKFIVETLPKKFKVLKCIKFINEQNEEISASIDMNKDMYFGPLIENEAKGYGKFLGVNGNYFEGIFNQG